MVEIPKQTIDQQNYRRKYYKYKTSLDHRIFAVTYYNIFSKIIVPTSLH